MRDVAPDEVQQPAATLAAHRAVQDVREAVKMTQADVLQHPHRHEHVVLAPHVAVVVVDELDLTGQTFALSPCACETKLFARHIERLHGHAVVARHVKRQGSPAAPGFDHCVARPQPQLAAHEIELGTLRLGERHRRVRVVGAGVNEVGIEPQLIEVVAEIVVVDIAAGVAERIGRGQQRPDASAPCRRRS